MKTVKLQNARKGIISATTIFVVVSVLFTFLSIDVGSKMIVGAFQDATDTSDRKWLKRNVIDNSEALCDSGRDAKIPRNKANFTRRLPGVEEFYSNDHISRTYVSVNNGGGDIIFDYDIYCNDKVGLNSSGSLTAFDPDKPFDIRLFGGSKSNSGEQVTIEVTQR